MWDILNEPQWGNSIPTHLAIFIFESWNSFKIITTIIFLWTYFLSCNWQCHLMTQNIISHLSMIIQMAIIFLQLIAGSGKRYLRVYIQIRFRHACHETRDRQSRSLVSGQEEGWGEVKVLLKFWIQLRSMSGLLKKKTQNKICLLKSKFEVICEQFWRAVKRMSVRLFIKKKSNNKFWTLFRKILKSD